MADGDSGVNARLAVGIEVRLKKLEEGLQQGYATAETGMTRIERRTKMAAERIAANLEGIKLSQRLDVARASGNNKLVEHLTEEIALRKTINDLTRAGLKGEEARAIAEAHVHALSKANAAKEGVGGAARHIFDQSRLTVFEEGGARLGVYGGALEKLGAAGLVAAAGLFAAGEAAEHAHEALEWADEVDRLATALGTSAETLQKLDYAADAMSIGSAKARENLQAFDTVLGALAAHAGDAKLKQYAEALKIDPDEIRKFKSLDQALVEVLEKIAAVPNAAERTKLAEAFHLEAFLPAIQKGKEGIEELTAKMREAQGVGAVISNEDIRRAAELNDRIEAAARAISVNLKSAFLDIGPILTDTVEKIRDAAHWLSQFVAQAKLAAMAPAPQRSNPKWLDQADQASNAVLGGAEKWLENTVASKWKERVAAGRLEMLRQGVQNVLAGKTQPLVGEEAWKPGRQLRADKEKPDKKGPSDQSDALNSTAIQALDSAQAEYLAALKSLTVDIEARAEVERRAIDSGLQKELDRLTADEIKVRKAKNDTNRADQLAKLAEAKSAAQAAAGLQKQKIDIDEQGALDQRRLAQSRFINQIYDQVQQIAAQEAPTLAARRLIELKILKAQERIADAELEAARQAELRTASTVGQRQEINSRYDARQGSLNDLNAARRRQLDLETMSPWDRWVKEGRDASAKVGETLQSEAVRGIDQFNDGIAQAIASGRNMGDVFKSIFAEMEVDLIRYLLKQAEVGVFGGGGSSINTGNFQFGAKAPASIFGSGFMPQQSGGIFSIFNSLLGLGGHADGTDSSPGGWKWVGERGPELMNVSRGSTVLSNANIRRLTSMPAMPQSGATVHQHFHLDARGAVMTEDLVASMRDYSDAVGTRAAQAGAALGKQQVMTRLQQRQRNTLG